jgi:hypothetical protein
METTNGNITIKIYIDLTCVENLSCQENSTRKVHSHAEVIYVNARPDGWLSY